MQLIWRAPSSTGGGESESEMGLDKWEEKESDADVVSDDGLTLRAEIADGTRRRSGPVRIK